VAGHRPVGRIKSNNVGNPLLRDSLADLAPHRIGEDDHSTQVTPAVEELAVACACGKGSRKFPQADVRAGRCQWSCGRRRCEPST
jgi:hypothetical protein